MRKNVLETKGVLTALVLVTGALLWPRISFAGVEACLSDDSYTDRSISYFLTFFCRDFSSIFCR